MGNRAQFIDSAVMTLIAAGAFALSLPQPARSDDEITPPGVPFDIRVPEGNRPFLVGHAVGTQNYVCLPSGKGGVAWTLFTPQATLFDDQEKQIITHFFSPNPSEDGTIRATWEHSRDTSAVWAQVIHKPSTDPNFVADGAVAWVLLQRAGDPGVQEGPTGGDTLTRTTFIQRVNTAGGVAPQSGCDSRDDVGNKAFVPYRADYFFYEAAGPS